MPIGIPVANSTVQHVTAEDIRDHDITQQVEQFNKALSDRLDETNFLLEDQQCPPDVYLDYDDSDNSIADNTDCPDGDESTTTINMWVQPFSLTPFEMGTM